MTERTAVFLAGLSHQWFLMVLPLPVIFGVATYYAGALWARANATSNTLVSHFYLALRVVAYALLVGSIAVFGIAFLHVGCASLKAQSAQCMSNVKQLSIGALMYAQDYDERLPASTRWAEAIDSLVRKSVKSNSSGGGDPFLCPAAESPASYGMNVVLGGTSQSEIDAPADTVLLFDADAPTRSFVGGSRDLAWRRHSHAPNVALADGHAKSANAFVLKGLIWMPNEINGPQQTGP